MSARLRGARARARSYRSCRDSEIKLTADTVLNDTQVAIYNWVIFLIHVNTLHKIYQANKKFVMANLMLQCA